MGRGFLRGRIVCLLFRLSDIWKLTSEDKQGQEKENVEEG